MPELPEVESLVRGLKKVLVNETIKKVEVRLEKLIASHGTTRKANKKKTAEFVAGITGKKIINVSRRAKNIIITLNDESVILIHLKMTGQLVFVANKNSNNAKHKNASNKTFVAGGHPITESYTQSLPNKHSYIILTLTSGTLYYNDVRQFGYALYYPSIEKVIEDKHWQGVGLEPFDNAFTLEYFKEKIGKKNKNIKTTLLEQNIVVGCGNIYADEICFASQVLPTRNCKTLTAKEVELVYNNIKTILDNAISLGGSSVSNYLLADGSRGNYAREHKVYGRTGKQCLVCDSSLLSQKIGSRTTVYCKMCQK